VSVSVKVAAAPLPTAPAGTVSVGAVSPDRSPTPPQASPAHDHA